MKNGYLKVETFIGERLAPVVGTKVVVECQMGNILHEVFTNLDGHSEIMPLKAVDETKAPSDPWNTSSQRYKVTVIHKRGFRTTIVHGVEIFPGIDSILPIRMLPDPTGDSEPHEIFIPKRVDDRPCGCPKEGKLMSAHAVSIHAGNNNELTVPSHITVRTNDGNIQLPLKDYIKNITSAENIHSSEYAALGANILLQVSKVVERVAENAVGELAESDFPFVCGRSILSNVSKTVDELWGYYFVASDETQTAPNHNRAWQDSANALAIRGYNPVQIVNYLCPGLVIMRFLEEGTRAE